MVLRAKAALVAPPERGVSVAIVYWDWLQDIFDLAHYDERPWTDRQRLRDLLAALPIDDNGRGILPSGYMGWTGARWVLD